MQASSKHFGARLYSYDKGLILNKFIWGLRPGLARSVSLHYHKTIAQVVLLAETMEFAVKSSRRPNWKGTTTSNPPKGQQGRGQREGRGRRIIFPGRGRCERFGGCNGFGRQGGRFS